LPLIKPRLQVERLRSTAPPSTTAVTIRFDQKPSAHAMQISIYSSIQLQLAKCSSVGAHAKSVFLYICMYAGVFPAAGKARARFYHGIRCPPVCMCAKFSSPLYISTAQVALFFCSPMAGFSSLMLLCKDNGAALWVITALCTLKLRCRISRREMSVLVRISVC
jgi:hypothetical protein